MNKKTWNEFCRLRSEYQKIVKRISRELPELIQLQQKLVDERDGPNYRVETPVVYNTALDEITPGTQIKLILVADNPGRREQAAENRRYLVGPSGKIAAGFFAKHSEFKINFHENVLILNKTPIHTPRTIELAELCRNGGTQFKEVFLKSQIEMVSLLIDLHRCFAPVPIWIIGYSEMKKKGLFEEYTGCLKNEYDRLPKRREELFFYRHFSMNQFTIDLNKQRGPGESCAETLKRIGAEYRERILAGF